MDKSKHFFNAYEIYPLMFERPKTAVLFVRFIYKTLFLLVVPE